MLHASSTVSPTLRFTVTIIVGFAASAVVIHVFVTCRSVVASRVLVIVTFCSAAPAVTACSPDFCQAAFVVSVTVTTVPYAISVSVGFSTGLPLSVYVFLPVLALYVTFTVPVTAPVVSV